MSRVDSKSAYGALAPYYEYFMSDCDYDKWSQYVYEKVVRYAPSKSGADIACGSGYFTRALKKKGLEVFGYDISSEMLDEARKFSAKEGLNIEYVIGDIKSFKSLKKLGFITAVNDGFNYVEPKNLERAFRAAARNLVKGGVLVFDVSSEYKLREIIGNNVFSEDYDDVTYLWFNELSEDKVRMEISIFKREGELYRRSDETHVQYIHKREDIEEALRHSGFEIKEVSGHLGAPVKQDTERLNFIAVYHG